MHQLGKTAEACDFLRRHAYLFHDDSEKYENLLKNLDKQIVPTGNCYKKNIQISNIPTNTKPSYIEGLFKNPNRIQKITINEKNHTACVHFISHSAARKTLEGFGNWEFPLTW